MAAKSVSSFQLWELPWLLWLMLARLLLIYHTDHPVPFTTPEGGQKSYEREIERERERESQSPES